jgi:hypothetical protein
MILLKKLLTLVDVAINGYFKSEYVIRLKIMIFAKIYIYISTQIYIHFKLDIFLSIRKISIRK